MERRVTMHETQKIARRPVLAGLFVFLAALALAIGCAAVDVFPALAQSQSESQQSQRTGSITVSAAISLKDALAQLGPMYEKRVPGAKIVFNYGGSGTLEQQIEQGAPVDIFFSAATQQMDQLKAAGLVDGTPVDLVTNSLVLIAPADNDTLKTLDGLEAPFVKKIALGETKTVPAGMYAQESLQHLGLWGGVTPKVVFAKDVRAVLTYVETGNADAGFVYETDALTSKKVRVVTKVPDDTHAPIVYPAAVLKNSKNPELAKAFLDFLAGADARLIFQEFGFAPPPGAASEKTAAKN
jgi:molybdate transport system substrate-binding protein